MQTTLALIKPDAMKNGHMIDILKFATDYGLVIADMMKGTWNRTLLAQFYVEH
jgi:nucleoside diphosphate kinase